MSKHKHYWRAAPEWSISGEGEVIQCVRCGDLDLGRLHPSREHARRWREGQMWSNWAPDDRAVALHQRKWRSIGPMPDGYAEWWEPFDTFDEAIRHADREARKL